VAFTRLSEFRVPKSLVGKLTENGGIPPLTHALVSRTAANLAAATISRQIECAAASRFLISAVLPGSGPIRAGFNRRSPPSSAFGRRASSCRNHRRRAVPHSALPGREAESASRNPRSEYYRRDADRQLERSPRPARTNVGRPASSCWKISRELLGPGLDDLVQSRHPPRQRPPT